MDTIKQTRVRFSGEGLENKETPNNLGKIPLQKTQSFRGDKKKSQNWFKRQFSRSVGEDSDSNYVEDYATAVAAAALAVNSLEDSVIMDTRKKDKSERTIPRTTTDKMMQEKVMAPAPSTKKTPTFVNKQSFTGSQLPEKTVGSATPFKKTPTFADKALNIPGTTKPESSAPKLDLPPTSKPALPPTRTTWQSTTRTGKDVTKADAWEKAELAKIKERYEKLKSTIQSWENKKAQKANRQKRRRESVLEQKRARDSQRHRTDMENINRIAGAARAQAEENRRNEELKVKEKANKYRRTGKLPTTCFCF